MATICSKPLSGWRFLPIVTIIIAIIVYVVAAAISKSTAPALTNEQLASAIKESAGYQLAVAEAGTVLAVTDLRVQRADYAVVLAARYFSTPEKDIAAAALHHAQTARRNGINIQAIDFLYEAQRAIPLNGPNIPNLASFNQYGETVSVVIPARQPALAAPLTTYDEADKCKNAYDLAIAEAGVAMEITDRRVTHTANLLLNAAAHFNTRPETVAMLACSYHILAQREHRQFSIAKFLESAPKALPPKNSRAPLDAGNLSDYGVKMVDHGPRK